MEIDHNHSVPVLLADWPTWNKTRGLWKKKAAQYIHMILFDQNKVTQVIVIDEMILSISW